jgi:hypothetical protein
MMGILGKFSARPGRRPARAAAVTAVLAAAAGLVAAGGGVASAADAAHLARAGSAAVLGAGQVGPRSAVPWRRVGPGWVLADYWNGRFAEAGKPVAAAATLYLVDPAGGRYQLYRTAVTKSPPVLLDWSGDKTRALLQTATAGGLEQVTLTTGRVSRQITLPGGASASGYTRPSGLNLLGWRQAGARQQLARYSLTGALTRVLAAGPGVASAMYSASGTTLAAGTSRGLELVSNSGGVIRALPVAGTTGCDPARWWNSATVLASCSSSTSNAPRLWLVPASGARPTALTPPRGARSGDLGDVDAWRLPSGLYLQALGPCGTVQIFRQQASGAISLVTVPHTAGNNRVLTADGSRLLVEAPDGCSPTSTVLWFNPATRGEHVLFSSGVLGAVPYGQPAERF